MPSSPDVTLFIPCLVDQLFPAAGLAMVKVLRHVGCRVFYNPAQVCCGQPAFNAGQCTEARTVARVFMRAFEGAECVVAPSGSCTAMVRNYYPPLFEGEPDETAALEFSGKVQEFSQFLVNTGLVERISGKASGRVGFHHSCHSFRELRIKDEPLRLMRQFTGFTWAQPEGDPVCCGFGGLFCAKFPEISAAMAHTRLRMFTDAGADTIVVNDPGCIMQLRQEAEARGISIRIIHLAEFLAEGLGN